MSRMTKAQLAEALGDAQRRMVDEREKANATIRRLNEQLCGRLDAGLDAATSINQARARQLEAEDRARAAQESERRVTERVHVLQGRLEDSEHAAEVAGLERQVAELQLENARLRHGEQVRQLQGTVDLVREERDEARQLARNPDLALTLDNGQVLSLEHQTYNGRWQVDGYRLLVDGDQDKTLSVTLTRVRP